MAQDLSFTAGLNDKAFVKGMERIKAESDKAAARMGRAFNTSLRDPGFMNGLTRMEKGINQTSKGVGRLMNFGVAPMLMGKALRIAGDALDEYAKHHADAQVVVDHWEEVGRNMLEIGGGILMAPIRWLDAAAGIDVNGELQRRETDRVLQANAKMMKAEHDAKKKLHDDQLRLAGPMMRERNFSAGMTALEAEDEGAAKRLKIDREHEKALDEIYEATNLLTQAEKERLGVEEIAHKLTMDRNAALGRLHDEDRQAAEKLAGERSMRLESLQGMLDQNEVAILRAKYEDDAADRMELQLEYAGKIRDVTRDTLIDEGSRTNLLARLQQEQQAASDALENQITLRHNKGPGRYRTFGGELGAGGVSSLVTGSGLSLGSTSGMGAARSLEDAAKKSEKHGAATVKELQGLRQDLQRGMVATFG